MKQRDVESLHKLIEMPDSAFYGLDGRAAADLGNKTADLLQSEGLAIAMPGQVDLDRRSTLPFLALTWISNLRNWEVSGARNRQVVVMDLLSGKATVHDPFAGPRREDLRDAPKSREGRPEDVPAPKAFSGGCDLLDMRAFANLPWEPGKYSATWIQYDWRSNTETVELIRGKPAGAGTGPAAPESPRIPYAEAVEKAYAILKGSQSPYPAIAFGSAPETPRLTASGIALDVPEAFSPKPKPWIIHGAARLELLPGHLVEKPVAGYALPGNRSAPPAALVPLSLLIAALDQPLRKVDFTVPVAAPSGKAALSAGDVVESALRIDLKSALHSELPPGEYRLYAAAGAYLAGPYSFSVPKR